MMLPTPKPRSLAQRLEPPIRLPQIIALMDCLNRLLIDLNWARVFHGKLRDAYLATGFESIPPHLPRDFDYLDLPPDDFDFDGRNRRVRERQLKSDNATTQSYVHSRDHLAFAISDVANGVLEAIELLPSVAGVMNKDGAPPAHTWTAIVRTALRNLRGFLAPGPDGWFWPKIDDPHFGQQMSDFRHEFEQFHDDLKNPDPPADAPVQQLIRRLDSVRRSLVILQIETTAVSGRDLERLSKNELPTGVDKDVADSKRRGSDAWGWLVQGLPQAISVSGPAFDFIRQNRLMAQGWESEANGVLNELNGKVAECEKLPYVYVHRLPWERMLNLISRMLTELRSIPRLLVHTDQNGLAPPRPLPAAAKPDRPLKPIRDPDRWHAADIAKQYQIAKAKAEAQGQPNPTDAELHAIYLKLPPHEKIGKEVTLHRWRQLLGVARRPEVGLLAPRLKRARNIDSSSSSKSRKE